MGKFLELVRAGAIKQPRHREFTAAAWRTAYEATRTDAIDDELLDAGLWFRDRLTPLWDRINDGPLGSLLRPMLIRALCGAANLEGILIERELKSDLRQRPDATTLAHTFFQQKLKDPASGSDYTADQLFTGLGDALSLALDYAFRRTEEKADTSASPYDDAIGPKVRHALRDFHLVGVFEYKWSKCLYLDLRLITEKDRAILRNRDEELALSLAVADHQNRSRAFIDGLTMKRLWHEGYAPRRRMKCVDNLDIKSGRLRFSLRVPRPRREEIPMGLITRHAIETAHIEDLLLIPLPGCPEVTLGDLLDAFEVLHSFAEALRSKLAQRESAGNAETFRSILAMAPPVRTNDLKRLVQQATEMSRTKASAAVDFLTYRGKARDGVWAKPLVAVEDGFVTVVLDSLLRPNHDRMLDHWLIDGGLQAAERGKRFESYVRKTLATVVAKNPLLARGAKVYRGSATIGPKGATSDVDLLLEIGTTVFVGELKCRAYPTEAKELHWHLQEIRRAAQQAAQRAALAMAQPVALLKLLGLRIAPEEVKIVPFVLLNTPVGAGMEFNGVQVTDLVSLRNFLGEGTFPMAVSGDGEIGVTIQYYTKSDEAERRLPVFLKQTPAMMVRRMSAREAIYRFVDPVVLDVEIVEFGIRIELPETDEGSLQSARDTKALWDERAAAADTGATPPPPLPSMPSAAA